MFNTRLLFTAITLVATAASADLRAEAPERAFLDGLRARGYHDTALEFLDSLETSPLVPAELKQVIPFEKAITLVQSSRSERDMDVRFRKIDQAQLLLSQFIQAQGSHPKAYAARSQLGNLIVERARIKVEQSKAGNSATLLKQARTLYEQAYEQFSLLEAAVTEELDTIPKVLDTRDRKQAALAARRKQLRADNLQTELLAAAIREESADTVADGSKQQLEYLNQAALLYDGIYKKYRSRLAGLYARMYQGRCNHRLGRTKDALGYYGELLDQPDQPEEMRELKTRTLRLAMESWLAPSENKYLEAIKRASEWLLIVPRSEQRTPDMLAIRYNLAVAYKMQADDLAGRQPKDTRLIAVSIASGKDHAEYVAGEPGELQEQAQQLVVKLGGRQLTDEDRPPQTFTEAQEAGKKALDEITPASQHVAEIQTRLDKAKPDQRDSMQQQLVAAQAKLASVQSDAMQNYRLAMRLADEETSRSELNLVRYFVCYLYYLDQQYYEAALLGDFVSKRFPESAGARQCAKIALASYITMLESADVQSNRFEVERVVLTAEYIDDRWPGTAESVQSLTTVVPVLVNAGALAEARQVTLRIPTSDPGRGQAELVTGQAMWGRHLQLLQTVQSDPSPSDDRELSGDQPLARYALELLTAGYGRLPDQPPATASNATALLSLAQAYVQSGRHPDAAAVLEHESIGPITLVKDGHEVVKNPVFVEETYRTALQAYVGSMKDDRTANLEKAKTTMAALQEAVGSDQQGKKRMLAIYVSLAKSVELQMKSAAPEAKQELSQVFEAFLQELSQGSSEVAVLNWVAETFASLGSGFEEQGQPLNENAKRYYERSIGAFGNVINATVDPVLTTQFKARMAAVKAKYRDFDGALTDFLEILAQNPKALNVQVATAELLQQWGATDPKRYEQAISGISDQADGVIWGWGKIANSAMQYQQFRDTFFRARFEIARCQLGLGRFDAAKQTLTQTKQLYPSLGGPQWTQRYTKLLREIESGR